MRPGKLARDRGGSDGVGLTALSISQRCEALSEERDKNGGFELHDKSRKTFKR